MRRFLSTLLAVVLLLGSLSLDVFAEDAAGGDPTPVVAEIVPDDVQDEAEEATEQTDDDTSDGLPIAEEDESAPEDEAAEEDADESEETEEVEETEETEEAEEAVEEVEEAATEEALFVSGYVRVAAKTAVYESMNEAAVYATFAEDSVVFAEISMRSGEYNNSWLALTLDTARARNSEEDFVTVYVRLKNVTPLSAEESEAFKAELLQSEGARLYRKLPLDVTVLKLVSQPEASEQTTVYEELEAEETLKTESAPADESADESANAAALAITTQPSNQKAALGGTAVFTVAASGATTYQWQVDRKDDKGFVNLSNTASYKGTATATLEVKATASTAQYDFRAVVGNGSDQVISKSVSLTIVEKPEITKQPVNASGAAGAVVTFTVTATDADSYQWQVDRADGNDFVNLGNTASYKGVTTAKLEVTAKKLFESYKYRVVLSNVAGETVSAEVTLTIVEKPVITEQPADQPGAVGSTVGFTVKATDAESYQWQVDRGDGNGFVNLNNTASYSGVTTDKLSVVAKELFVTYKYRVVVSNAAGSVDSENAQLSIIQPPVITEQPADQTAPVGTTAVFTVKATGADKYQWQVNRGEGYVDLSNSPSYSGVKTDTLSVVSKELFATYKYRVVVSNAAGEVKSSSAKLIPILPPVLTQQPENQTVGEGSYASFTVKQNNAKTIQWQVDRGDDKGFVDLGETATYKNVKSETLSVKGTTSTANYKFQVVLANEAGQVVSDTVKLNVVFRSVITKQPANQTVGEGSFAKFTVKYDSADSIRWQVDRGEGFVDLLSDTPTYKDVATATLSVKGTESTATYKFKAVLTNLAGETKSNPVTLTVVPKVVITTQPTNQPGAKDAYSTFTVEAENVDVIHWQVDRGDGFVNLTETATYKGTTTKALTVKGSDSTANYKFRAVLSNLAGEVISNTVRINPYILPPVIKTQPVDQDALVDSYAVFTASVTNADSLQWQVNRNDGNGYVDLGETATYKNATTDALSVKATASTATYSFRLVATNLAGETKSNVVKLTAWSPIVITSQPENQQGVIGATVQFTVAAKNATSVQWQVNRNDGKDFVDLGETPTFQNAKTYTLSVKVTENTATYTFRAVLKSKVETIASETAVINLVEPPIIISQPSDQTGMEGETVVFTIVSENADTIQWQVNRGTGFVDLNNSATYQNVKTDKLSVLVNSTTVAYSFRATLTNSAGSVISNEVTLQIAGTVYEDYAFSYINKTDCIITSYYGHESAITIPAQSPDGHRVTGFGESAFANNTSLVSVALPDSITSISNRAFYNCSSLTNIGIPNSCTSIGE